MNRDSYVYTIVYIYLDGCLYTVFTMQRTSHWPFKNKYV